MGVLSARSCTPWNAAGMYPLDQFFGPLIGPPLLSSITTNPGRFSFSLPRPYVTQLPRHGLPLSNLPLFIIRSPDPWIGLSAYIEWRNAMSSTHDPTFGNRSDTRLPHFP